MKDILARIQEVNRSFLHADPTMAEMTVGFSALVFGVWIAVPFPAPPPPTSVLSKIVLIMPESMWALLFMFAALLLIFAPRHRSYYNIGILLTAALWFFFFLVAFSNGLNTLAPAAYCSNILLCIWIYLRRSGALGAYGVSTDRAHRSDRVLAAAGGGFAAADTTEETSAKRER